MKYNFGYFQFRDYQIETMGKIIKKNLSAEKGGLLFYGDSITENYNIERFFPEISIKYNSGISGFTSESLLWFCDEAVIKYQPRLLVLMIGINDQGSTSMLSPKQTALNIKNLVEMLDINVENIRFALISTLPWNLEQSREYQKQEFESKQGIRSNELIRKIFQEVQKMLADYRNIVYIDAFPEMLDENNNLNKNYTLDGIHLSEKGYEKLTEIIKPVILDCYLKNSEK
jgi:lysophospholipase L1-like esterase